VGVEEEVDEVDEEEEDEELEEDTLKLELELREREDVGKSSEVGEGGSDELELGNWLETDETELAGPLLLPLLVSLPSFLVPGSRSSPKFCLPRSAGDRLRSILCPSS